VYSQNGPSFEFPLQGGNVNAAGEPTNYGPRAPGPGVWGGRVYNQYNTFVPTAWGKLTLGDLSIQARASRYRRATLAVRRRSYPDPRSNGRGSTGRHSGAHQQVVRLLDAHIHLAAVSAPMKTIPPAAKTAVRLVSRRALLHAAAAAAIGGVVRRAHAADVNVPVRLQSVLIGKVAAFDRAFQARSGPTTRLGVVHKGGDSTRIGHQIASALDEMPDIAGLRKSVEMLDWSSPAALASAVQARPTALAYLSLGLEADAPAIADALVGADVLTVGATGLIAERGACVGFELEEGKPRIYVNLRVAKAQKVDFRAELLRLVKLV
jgi:hypothetical protein